MMAPFPISFFAARCQSTASIGLLIIAVSTGMQGCRSGPLISQSLNQSQWALIPEAEEIQLGKQAYEQTLSTEPISHSAEIQDAVERVGKRLAAVAGKPDYEWEFRVIAKRDPHAFALPGGKVALHEGILPYCQSEAGLAVVLSHEIAHAIARHGVERMTQPSAEEGAGGMLDPFLQAKLSPHTTDQIRQGYGVVGTSAGGKPFSRQHEAEADAIGLILMARAGYDPSVAPEFWERLSSISESGTATWATTHPADARRSAELRALLPEAMKYYQAAQVQLGMGDPLPAPSESDWQSGDSVRLAKALQPAPATVVVGQGAFKKSGLPPKQYVPADDVPAAVAEQLPGNEPIEIPKFPEADSSEFKLPIKMGADGAPSESVPQVQAIDPLGWETSGT